MKLSSKMKAIVCTICAMSVIVHAETMNLEQVIQKVCVNSDSVKMMKETLYKAEQAVNKERSAAFPSIMSNISADRKYSRISMPTNDGTGAPSYSGTLSAKQTLNIGKVGTALNVAKQYYSAIKNTYNRNLQSLQLSTLDAFYRVVLADMTVAVSHHSLTRKTELFEFLDRNFKLGSGAKAQVLMTQSDVKGASSEIITAQQNANAAHMMLNALMGLSLTEAVQLDTSLQPSIMNQPLPASEDAVRSALERRGDLCALDYFAKANAGGVKILRATYLPDLSATGLFSVGGDSLKHLVDWDKRSWSVGVGMTWIMFDGLQVRSLMQQYRSDVRKLELAQKAVSKMIEIEILTAISECAAADSNLIATQEMLAAATESYELTNENFKQGSGLFSDLQNAEERLRQAETGTVNARYRVLRSRAALQVAQGKDIITLEE